MSNRRCPRVASRTFSEKFFHMSDFPDTCVNVVLTRLHRFSVAVDFLRHYPANNTLADRRRNADGGPTSATRRRSRSRMLWAMPTSVCHCQSDVGPSLACITKYCIQKSARI